jgi:hypothetical protein
MATSNVDRGRIRNPGTSIVGGRAIAATSAEPATNGRSASPAEGIRA